MSAGLTTSISQDTMAQERWTSREVMFLSILAVMQFTFIVDYILMMPLGSHLMASLSIGPQEFSYLISTYTISAAISGLLASFFIDRFERKRSILICYLGFSLGPIITITAENYNTLLLARVFSGAFGGVLTSIIMTIIGDAVSRSKIGRATSFVLSANAVASIVGVPLAIFLVSYGSWKTPFMVLLPLELLMLLVGLMVLPKLSKHLEFNSSSKRVWSTVINAKFIWPLVFMSLLTFAGGFTILPFLPTFVTFNYNFIQQEISYLFFLGGLSSFITAPMAGLMSDKFGRQNVFLWLNFLSIIPIILLTIFPLENKVLVIVVSAMFFMFSTGRHVSGMALINERFNENIRGRFISLNSSFQLFTGSLGTICAGYLIYHEEGMLYNFDLIGIIAICATIVCIFTAFIIDE
ncbi:MAG: MFS transporter [Cytophagaceae bacterium]|nr:MFS transporter [Cytophagaceae bacterium]